MAYSSVMLVFPLFCLVFVCSKDEESPLLLVTVATEPTDGFLRFAKSAKKLDLDLEVLGMGEKWEGGDVANSPGGGQKIQLLQKALEKHRDRKDLVVMFSDTYDLIITDGADEILKRFKTFDAKVVFSTERFDWMNESPVDQYPHVKKTENRFLNSGMFIGYAPQVYALVNSGEMKHDDANQLFYTNTFLDKKMRDKLSIKLDTRSELFHNLYGAIDAVEIKFKGAKSYLYNSLTGNIPIVIHGNGPIKDKFNSLVNYLNDNWTPTTGCQICDEGMISLDRVSHDDFPTVSLAIFLDYPTAFAEDFFKGVSALNYPKEKMTLLIHYADQFNEQHVLTFMDSFGIKYNRAQVHGPSEKLTPGAAKNKALEACMKANCQYYFHLEGHAQLENPEVLVQLIQRNRSAIAPFLMQPDEAWSNFWGSLSRDGFYEQSDDYVDIIEHTKLGVWNVPYITAAYLIHGYHIPKLLGGYEAGKLDSDMSICSSMRQLGIFMYVDNTVYNGHLVDIEDYEYTNVNSDLYDLLNNKYTWERRYLHPDYHKYLEPDTTPDQPCPDVFWLPFFSETFCKELIEVAEANGQWSGGQHDDPRLEGGYENVPTDDIHMNQLDWEDQWFQILDDYIGPIAERVYAGYETENESQVNFIVRYNPAHQDRLRPHSDTSTFTINVALNRPHIDYEGGGVRFLRYNCTVTDMRLGWGLLHPGRLTHQHEGLPTTGGTRYIMVSFIDP